MRIPNDRGPRSVPAPAAGRPAPTPGPVTHIFSRRDASAPPAAAAVDPAVKHPAPSEAVTQPIAVVDPRRLRVDEPLPPPA